MKDIKSGIMVDGKLVKGFSAMTYQLFHAYPYVEYTTTLNGELEIQSVSVRQNGRWYQIAPAGPVRRLWHWLRGYRR